MQLKTTAYFREQVLRKRPYLTEGLILAVLRSPELRRYNPTVASVYGLACPPWMAESSEWCFSTTPRRCTTPSSTVIRPTR